MRFLRGAAGLTITILVVPLLLVFLPAYRLFFLIGVGIGLALRRFSFWHKLRPLKEEDIQNQGPLGL